jgi:hypothetical protein
MKKSIGSIFLAAALAATFTGCADKASGVNAEEQADFRCRINNVLAPEWACGNEGADGAITAVGVAPMSKLGEGFSRREAIANGRSNLAQQIQTLVKDKVETFTRSTGVGGDEVADKVSTQVSKQVAKETLSGSKQIKRWQDPTNSDIYVLMGVDENAVNKEAKNSVKSSYKNDNALWQQFQSKQALESLDKEFPTN